MYLTKTLTDGAYLALHPNKLYHLFAELDSPSRICETVCQTRLTTVVEALRTSCTLLPLQRIPYQRSSQSDRFFVTAEGQSQGLLRGNERD